MKNISLKKINCPLCLSSLNSAYYEEKGFNYYLCSICDLVSLDPDSHLSPDEEKARYLLHNNDIHDSGYQEFVRPLFDQVRKNVAPGSEGLDFGSGTGPVLSHLFKQSGYKTRLYDPYFHPKPENLKHLYDFAFSCEVMEHLHKPNQEFRLLSSLLKPGGILGVMTSMRVKDADFGNWHYRRDPTHVAFYSHKSLEWAANNLGFESVWFPEDRVAIFRAKS